MFITLMFFAIILFSGCNLATQDEIEQNWLDKLESERLIEEEKISDEAESERLKLLNSTVNMNDRNFEENNDTVIYDKDFQINWILAKKEVAESYEMAYRYCNALDLHLPTIMELQTIINHITCKWRNSYI